MFEFLAMGGYAAFVWPAYGLALVVLCALAVSSLRMARTAETEVRTLEESAPRRPGRKDASS